MFPQGFFPSLPELSFEQRLEALYQNRLAQAIEALSKSNHPKMAAMNADQVKLVVHAAFILCEVHLYEYFEKSQVAGAFNLSPVYKDYYHVMKYQIHYKMQDDGDWTKGILENLSRDLCFSSDILTFLEQAPIQIALNELINKLMNSPYAGLRRNASSWLFNPEGLTNDFSWENAFIKENPWMITYKNIFLSDKASQIIAAVKMSSPYSDVVVRLGELTTQPKKIKLHAKTSEQLIEKIETLKKWAKSSDSTRVFPENLEMETAAFIRPSVDKLIKTYIKTDLTFADTETWFSTEISTLLPPLLRASYGANPFDANCYGGALASLGLLTIPRHHDFSYSRYCEEMSIYYIDDDAKNNAIKLRAVNHGKLEMGDMINFCGYHGFIYLDPDISINMRGPGAPWLIISTREVFKSYHAFLHRCYDFAEVKPEVDYANSDLTSIKTLKEWGVHIHRKSNTCQPMVDQSIADLILIITKIMTTPSRLHGPNAHQHPTIKELPEYRLLADTFQELINKLADLNSKDKELLGDIGRMKHKLPEEIRNLTPVKKLALLSL